MTNLINLIVEGINKEMKGNIPMTVEMCGEKVGREILATNEDYTTLTERFRAYAIKEACCLVRDAEWIKTTNEELENIKSVEPRCEGGEFLFTFDNGNSIAIRRHVIRRKGWATVLTELVHDYTHGMYRD